MSTETKARKDRGVASETELLIGLFKVVAALLSSRAQDDQNDLIELLGEMVKSQTKEEMIAAEETIREVFKPKAGTLISLVPAGRPSALQNWADFAGGRVRDFRKQAGLTQAELAEKSGLPQSHVSRIENAEVSPNRMTLEKIAKALNRPIGDFDPSA